MSTLSSDPVLQVYTALQHLQHGRSTVELAEELELSRFAVGRMIRRAVDGGLVEVVSRLDAPIDPETSARLALKFGLKSAIVVTPPADTEVATRGTVAKVAARYVSEAIREDDVVGLGPGRTIVEMCAAIRDVPVCDVVQLTGVASERPEEDIAAIMQLRSVARGRMFPLHAPLLTTDQHATRVIGRQPTVKQALHRMDRIDLAVLTIGGWPHSALLANQLSRSGELDGLMQQGVVAELGTTLLDRSGAVQAQLEGRLIGLTTAQLLRVSQRVAIGGGPGKRHAVVAVLKSQLADVVITDKKTAIAALGA